MAATAWSSTPALALDFPGDERLARLAARGDERAFGALFARHQPGVTRYARGILRNDADAEDAAQNAMMAALRALEGGTIPMRVKPWLYRIAHNEAISLVRRRRVDAELDEMTLPAVGGAEEASAIRERLGQLMTDLQELSERQRQALVLRELYDFSYTEIATTLDCTEAAAQQTVFEARSSLQHFDAGREMECEGVQRAMSACDGMRLRTRTFRAHIRDCHCCREFETALRARRRDLGLLFPPVGGAGGVFALLARLFGAGGGGSALGGLGVKGAVVGLAVLAGGGAVVGVTTGGGGSGSASPARVAPAGAVASPGTTAGGAGGSAGQSGEGSGAAGGGSAGGKHGRGTGKGKGAAGSNASGTDGSASGADGSASPGATSAGSSSGSGGGVGHTGDGSDGGSGGGGGSSDPTSSLPVKPPSPVKQAADKVAGTVTGATQGTGQAVQDTGQQVTNTASGAVDSAGDAVQGTADSAGDAVGDAVNTVTDAVGDATQNLPHLP